MIVSNALKAQAVSGEGPLWDYRNNKLYWLDIRNKILNEFDEEYCTNKTYELPERISSIVPYKDSDFAGANPYGLTHLYKKGEKICSKQIAVFNSNENITSNDGRCDSCGRFVIGMMDKKFSSGLGSVHICSSKNDYSCFDDGYTLPNGVDWSLDETKLYVAESRPGIVYEYDYDIKSGTLKNKRKKLEIKGCDGMCTDEYGNLYIAKCGFGKVVCYNPNKDSILYEISFPVLSVTSCVFGGKNLDILFVTTASWDNADLMKRYPDVGSLYRVDNMPVKGRKANKFILYEEYFQ